MTSTTKQAFRAVITVCVLSLTSMAALSIAPSNAQAQATASRHEVEASPKGMIGLGLVGGELGLVLPAAFGLTDLWAMIAFPIVGAAGGAAAGYFLVDDKSDNGKMGVAMMTIGMVLVIPALVLTASLGRYDPESDEGALSARLLARMDADQRARVQAGPGLVRVSERGLMVAAPGLEFGASKREGRTDRRVEVAMLSGSF